MMFVGAVHSIIIRPEKRGVPQHIHEAILLDGGIAGDHYANPEGHRHITLIASDALATVSATVGFHGDAHKASRRNICVDTLPEGNLVGRQMVFGNDVVIEVTRYCTPCSRMNENFGDGTIDAFANKAGWCAKIIHQGKIKVGDPIYLL